MGRTPSPNPKPDDSGSKSPKTNANRVQKKSSQKNSNLGQRIQDITAKEFVNFFQLRGDNVTVYIGSHAKSYNVPRQLLIQKSPYLSEILKDTHVATVRIQISTRDAFETILQNLYTDKITLPDYAQLKPSKAITKYLDIIQLTGFLQLTTDLLARNAATAIWAILRNHPSKIRDRHLQVIFSESWPKGWAFDNVRKEFVKEMAEEWFDVTVGANTMGGERKYDLEGAMKRDGEVARLVLEAVGKMLKKRVERTGVHPLTGKVLPVAEEVEEEVEEVEEYAEDEEEVWEGEGDEEGDEYEEAEEEYYEEDEEAYPEDSEDSTLLEHDVSEKGRFWEVVKKH